MSWFFADRLEQKHTQKNINKFGYHNVRGGKYINSKTLKKTNNNYNPQTSKFCEFDEDSDCEEYLDNY